MTEGNQENGGFFNSLYSNIQHCIPMLFYEGIGAATKVDLPIVGKISPAFGGTFYIANMYARYDQINKDFAGDKHKIATEHHKMYADYIVNIGISAAGAFAFSFGIPVGVAATIWFVGTELFAHGDNAPIDNLKMYIAGGFDTILGDHF